MLTLDGTRVLGHEIAVSATLSLAGEDISGQSSMAATSETGDKPKSLSVNMVIRYVDSNYLSSLVNLAQAKTEFGERKTYSIINRTAQAMNIRQVRFLGDLTAREDDTLNFWRVSFRFIEVKSVPELTESRQNQQSVTDQPAAGDQTVQIDTAVDQSAELVGFEQVLAHLDNATGKNAAE